MKQTISGSHPRPHGRLGERLLSDTLTARGFWNAVDDPTAIRRLAKLVDFVIVDLEHGNRDLSRTCQMIFGVWASSSEVLIRLSSTQDPLVQTFLDLGVSSFLLPQVRSAEEVAEFVKRTRWAPLGQRGVHPRADHTTVGQDGYISIFPLIETRESLEALEHILSCDGVTGCYFGAYDLAQDLGVSRNSDEMARIFNEVRQVVASMKKTLIFMPSDSTPAASDAYAHFEKHVVGIDTELLIDGLSSVLRNRE